MAVKGNNAGAPCRPLGRRAVARLFELAFPHAPPRIYMRESKAKGEQSGSLLRSRLRPHSLSARHRSGGATPGWFQGGGTRSAWLGVAPNPSWHAARVARGDRGKARDAPPNRLGGLGCAQAAPRGAAGLAGGAPLGSRLGPHGLPAIAVEERLDRRRQAL